MVMSLPWDMGEIADKGVESMDAPLGRENVITCYGILGVLSLATSISPTS